MSLSSRAYATPRRRRVGLGLLMALALAGCTSVQTEERYAGPKLARPDIILVYDFAVSPDEVDLDKGFGPEIEQAMKGTPRTEQEREVGHKVADALARHLVTEIRDLSLPAERAGAAAPPGGKIAMIEGQFISIDEGNRTERLVIGLGAGRSNVRIDVQVYDKTPEGERRLETLEVDAKSGYKPGFAETLPVGAVAGTLATTAAVSTGLGVADEAFSANVEAEADRAARGIAKHLAVVFAQEGWITAGD